MITRILALSLLAALCMGRLRAEETPLFDVPRLDNITIDGKAGDWGDRGLRVGILEDEANVLRPAADLDASFRLGWDERGLLVLISVSGNVQDEATKNSELWQKDSVELFYAPQRGSPDVVQMVISPGMNPQHPELRSNLEDDRQTEALKKTKVTATAACTKTANGYTLDVLLPWANFGIKPEVGREIAFQLYVNNTDGGGRFQLLWYPISGAHDSMKMNRVRLSDKPGPPINALASADYERFRHVRVHVAGTTELLGKMVTVRDSGQELGRAPFAPDEGRAGASILLPMPPEGKAYGPLDVSVDGQLLKTIDLPDPRQARARAFGQQELIFNPGVFSGDEFPKCDFEQPSYVEDLIGPYTIATKFYDAAYNPVRTAEKPGRYGAVVEIKAEDGKTFRRLRTLFRVPEELHWWGEDIVGTIKFPREAGIDPAVAKEQKHSIDKYMAELLDDSFSQDAEAPALLAALYETKPGTKDAGASGDYLALDRQWWVGLKRKLNGADKLYPKPFVCPQIIRGKPVTVLHEGTLVEAGMKPGAAGKIDALLDQWSAASSEPFEVCIARHGVIILHKAYGNRDGKPMTVDTKSWMASLTKTMSGAAMMMLVDQGLVNLDDPVAKYLPAFGGVTVPTPLTIRHLYTHTDGLEGPWTREFNDFDEVVAGYYPYMPVGKRPYYNGAGPALGSKIVENITGEALPQFYKHHLLDPLGCPNTDVTDSSGDAESTAMDMAKIGQMLLNRGTYGDKRFMSAETFGQMLPVRLTKVLGAGTNIEWGIGLVWCKGEGLGEGTFGHGASSEATLRVDPEHDLVIVMCRNAPGGKFASYHQKFLSAIIENLAE